MSDKMNKLKEVAGENELDKELMDLIAVGNAAQIEELWNFYMFHGAGEFLQNYQNDHAKGVLEALRKDGNMLSIANAKAVNASNVYDTGSSKLTHGQMLANLNRTYENGNGFFGQAK